MNTQTLINHTFAGAPSSRRVFGAYLEEIRCEALRMLRNPGLAFPVMVIPVALYALLAVLVFAEGIAKDPMIGVYLFSAFSVMATSMPALFGIATSLALEREMGMLRLKRAQPAPTGSWLVAKIFCGLVFGIIAYLPLLGVALASGKLPLAGGPVVAMSLALIGGAVPFCAMGLMIGTLFKGSAAPGYANLIYLPGCYLGGLFFPLPPSLHLQTLIWPQFHVNQIAMHAAGVEKFQSVPLTLAVTGVIGFTVLFSTVAIWRLKDKG
jgi:ABC-2 type transport system permease protein